MKLSIIIPAFNEEDYLSATLDAIQLAEAQLRSRTGANLEIIVVDNNSTDSTMAIALAKGATVVQEPTQSIARARNTGAKHATGDVLVFIDADVIVPPGLLEVIHAAMNDPACVGGGVDVEYRPRRAIIRVYLRLWRVLGRLLGMVQGATQFCRRNLFEELARYDETAWIGEDVDFYWAMRRQAKRTHGRVHLVKHPRVHASSRRFDRWPVWKTLLWTNPAFIALFRKKRRFWGAWYSSPVR